MIIGTFIKTEAGHIEGDIRTFNLHSKLTLIAIENPGQNGPHYRVTFNGSGAEAGAAWEKTSNDGNAYLSLKLDGPTLDTPIYAALTKSDGGYLLNWSRPRPNAEPNGQHDQF